VVTELCDSVRRELESRDLEKYINSILTAYVVKRPPDLEAGLRILLQLRGTVATRIFFGASSYDSLLTRTRAIGC
jgi:hypothetical protein